MTEASKPIRRERVAVEVRIQLVFKAFLHCRCFLHQPNIQSIPCPGTCWCIVACLMILLEQVARVCLCRHLAKLAIETPCSMMSTNVGWTRAYAWPVIPVMVPAHPQVVTNQVGNNRPPQRQKHTLDKPTAAELQVTTAPFPKGF